MHPVLAGDLTDGFQSPGGFQRHPQLELRVVLSAFSARFHASTSCLDSMPIHLSLWSHFWGSPEGYIRARQNEGGVKCCSTLTSARGSLRDS